MQLLRNLAPDILETLRQPLLVLDGELRVQTASRAFYSHFQMTRDQTVGRRLFELGQGEWDIPSLRTLLEELLPANGHLDNHLLEQSFPGLGPRILRLNARRLHDDQDKTHFILLAIEDVTERETARREMEINRQWLHTTIRSIGDAVIATDAQAHVTFMNPAAERMTAWPQTDAAGRPLGEVFNIVNEETRKQVESPVSKAIRMGSIVGLANHTVLIARDGAELPIDDSAAPIRDETGGVQGVVRVFHDITERRASERKLEESERRYRRLFETAQDGLLILDGRTTAITDVNPFIIDLLGYPREHFLGKQLWEIGVFSDRAESQNAMKRLQKEGHLHYDDGPLEDRNGQRHPVEVVANLYSQDQGPVIQCNIRDISHRKRMECERQAVLANEQAARLEAQAAARANRAKDDFLATLSHEMRTPLNAIVGWAGILAQGDSDPQELQEGIEIIQRNARAQSQLIEDVLDVSRIVSGKMRLDVAPCNLMDPIRMAVDMVRPDAMAKGIELTADLDSQAALAHCDGTRIQQVVWNLLTNAVKFTAEGSVKVTLSREGSAAKIQVSDTGVGIAPTVLPFIFDRFRQADSSTKRKFGGLGLGLSIVKQLVEMHGGTVTAASAGENQGAVFTLTLPVRAPAEPADGALLSPSGAREMKTEEQPPRLDGLRVLVVEDEPDARRLVARVLERAGAKVTAHGSAPDALEELWASPHDLLISDIGMPDVDGYELIRRVREQWSGRDLPAIALTAFAQADDRRRILAAGFQVHVAKPIDPQDLLALAAGLGGLRE
jgi:PAS domain S-box-containing protein